MDLKNYISSGVLELYVLDQLNQEERKDVELMASKYPEVKEEIEKISLALEKYAFLSAKPMPSGLADQIINSVGHKNQTEAPKSNKGFNKSLLFSIGSALAMFGLTYSFMSSQWKSERLNYEKQLKVCDSIQAANKDKFEYADILGKEGTNITAIQATEKFPNTLIYLVKNKKTKSNYLQISNLAQLDSEKAYQLWALKKGENPMPLEVFDGDDAIVKVSYEGEVDYAITVEKKEGAASPDLANLVGVFKAE